MQFKFIIYYLLLYLNYSLIPEVPPHCAGDSMSVHTVCTGLQAQCNATGVTRNSRSRHSSSGAMGLEFSVSCTVYFGKKCKNNKNCLNLY